MTKKDLVLDVAAKLFSENGFEKTSVTNICETAKVSKGLVYHHFKSKEAILLEIFTAATNRLVALNKQPDQNENPNQQLVNLIESIFSQLNNDKSFFQLNLNLIFQPSTKKVLETQIKKRAALLFYSVKNIFDKISPASSIDSTYMFIAEIDGITLNYLSSFDEYPLELMEKELIEKYSTLTK